MKRILLFLSMLLLVGGTTMASLNGACPNYSAHLSNNESSTPTHHMRGAEQRNGNNAGSSALDVVALKKDNVNAQTLEQEGNKDQITFRTDKSVGEEIYLEISYPLGSNIESITVEGATLTKSEDFPNLLKSNRTYKLTSQEVRIIGEVSDFICANNKITSLDLSKCPNLRYLVCSNNLLESLHVDNCTNLSTLECNDNKIKELDLSYAKNLYSLDCSDNKITTLKTSLESITEIDCRYNEIKELNISAANQLVRLNCGFNKLNKLSIDNCPLLSVLIFSNNNISELSVQYNPKLIYVGAIESTTNMSLIEQLVASLPTVGDASNRQGDFRLVPSIEFISEFIEQYGINFLNALTKNLNNKGWKSTDVTGAEIPNFSETPYISFTTNKSVGETINVQLKMLPGANVEDIQLEGATLVSSTLKRDSERFSEYYFQTYKLTSNTVKILGHVSDLLCPNNELTSIDISNPELLFLEFPDNHITTVDTKKAKKLIRLDCSRNNFTTLDVSTNKALRVLICTENNISTLNLPQDGKLNYLFCSNNKLNELNISNTVGVLRAVYCNDNQITKLTITDHDGLMGIDCCRNNITEINIANNPNLKNLDIHKNKITLEQMEQLANDLPVESDPSNYERILILKDIVGEENKYSTEIINKILSKGWKVEDTNNVSLGISAIENDKNQPRKVFDLNGREVNENQVKGVVIIKQGNKTYKKVVK
ncbi:leucine-rich repeat domain-containing protein [Prevotella melaninogenica]|nr:hypothetical protein [Prevotella melaninogenica]